MTGRWFWGDLHNHNSVGLFHYAKGSLERSIDIARSHLDFFAFTGHARWVDMPEMPDHAERKWAEGFDHHARQWPTTKRLIAGANEPGRFAAFLGYEWHTGIYGDRHVLYPGDEGDLFLPDTIEALNDHARRSGAMLVPHHLGYRSGPPGRGVRWDSVAPAVSPVIEIFSEHGAAERDRGPYPYVSHSLGPRNAGQTLQRALELGFHVGVVASTDDHFGYPGAYGEGLAAVFAEDLTREAIWRALWDRRTYAVTGDRIEVAFSVNDEMMGRVLPAAADRSIRARVRGWDEVEMVEVVRNGEVACRAFPEPPDGPTASEGAEGRWVCRVEYGWGPWTALGMPRTADWRFEVRVREGRIARAMPCFQSGPFDEARRDRILRLTGDTCEVQSFTGRAEAYHGIPTKAVALEIEGGPRTVVEVRLLKPIERAWAMPLPDLARDSRTEFVGGFPAEAMLVHRLVPERRYTVDLAWTDRASADRDEDCYYLRVRQENGQMAWSSPVWVGCPR